MDFFRVDGKLYQFLSRFWEILKLNFFWLLFSLPIVTIGAATTAAFRVTLDMVEEKEGYVFQTFLKAFRENWKKGTLIGFLNVLLAYAVYLDFEFFRKLPESPVVFLIFGMFGTALCVASFLYAYALTARYDNSVRNTLKNSFRISVRYFGRTLLLLLVLAVELLVWWFNSTTIFLGLLVGPATCILTISGPAMHIFRAIEKEERGGDVTYEE